MKSTDIRIVFGFASFSFFKFTNLDVFWLPVNMRFGIIFTFVSSIGDS